MNAELLGWQFLSANAVHEIRDTVGAGDWCTAGLVHILGQQGRTGLAQANESDIERGLKFGQALAAWNCTFEGARGIMYSLDESGFKSGLNAIMAGEMPPAAGLMERRSDPDSELWSAQAICPACPS